MATPLREIFAAFGVDFDDRELKKGEAAVDRTTQKLKELATFIASAAFINGIKNFVLESAKIGDALDKTAQQIGLSTTEFQAFSHAANLSGVDAAAFTQSIGQLQQRAFQAARGTGEAAKIFRDFGIAITDSSGDLLPAGELLAEVADGISRVENSSERTAISMQLMGRSGRRLLPMFVDGREGIERMKSELEELGGGATPQFVAESVKLTDTMARMGQATLGLRSRIAVVLLPIIERSIRIFTELSSGFLEFTKNSNFVEVALATLGGVMLVFAAKSAIAFAPLLLNIGIIAAGILILIAVVDDLIVTFQGGESVIQGFVDEMFGLGTTERVVRTLTEAWQGLVLMIREAVEFVGAFLGISDRLPEGETFEDVRRRQAGAAGRSLRETIFPSERRERVGRELIRMNRIQRQEARRAGARRRAVERERLTLLSDEREIAPPTLRGVQREEAARAPVTAAAAALPEVATQMIVRRQLPDISGIAAALQPAVGAALATQRAQRVEVSPANVTNNINVSGIVPETDWIRRVRDEIDRSQDEQRRRTISAFEATDAT